ncbi:hypothetical protein PR202_gb13209 [Eleusine coracana subsp. coracana]|uniref:Uncharacterized protein n=1 Tax=Eleusine coracana subsp. coracana TaxID=191504 RepID=A0AAV5ESM1_ELECO|nr:hypothetical protein PR202_gb13209 [Eleusine coracana subsp. coracana]
MVYVPLTVPLIPNSIPGAPPLLAISSATSALFYISIARTKLCPSYYKTKPSICEQMS